MSDDAGILFKARANPPHPVVDVAQAVVTRGGGLAIMPTYEDYRPGGPFPKPSMILMRGSPTATPDDPSETPRSLSEPILPDEPFIVIDQIVRE